jgi:hypothetical protein
MGEAGGRPEGVVGLETSADAVGTVGLEDDVTTGAIGAVTPVGGDASTARIFALGTDLLQHERSATANPPASPARGENFVARRHRNFTRP